MLNNRSMTNTLSISSAQRNAIENFGHGTGDIPITITPTDALVGAVRVLTIGWTAHTINIAGTYYPVAAGTIALNAADVAAPTTYYVYARIVAGQAVVERSVTNPETDPAIGYNYSWVATCRFKSVGGTLTIYYLARSYIKQDFLAHFLGEWDYFNTPLWVSGGALTIDAASGEVDMSEVEFRRIRFEDEVDAVVNGVMLLDSEAATVANLELITTYSDGSPITAGKYHKVLLGVLAAEESTYPFIVMRQGVPLVEYATLAAAMTDAERVAASAWPEAYRGRVLPLAYIAMLLADASDLDTVDLRATGIIGGGGGGGAPIADHGLLAGLGDDDHAQYTLADGTRAFSGDIDLGANAITNVGNVDGVDISAHAANANAHHNQSHVLAGPAGLGPDHTAAGLTAGHALVATGAAAAQFQALVAANVSDFNEAAQDAVGAALLDSNTIDLTYNDAGNTITAVVRYQEGVLAVAAGNNNDVVCATNFQTIAADPGAAFTITGLAGGADGRRLILYNATTRNMTISNEDALSVAGNRIRTLGGTAATTGPGTAELIYSASVSRWILLGVHG